MTEEISNRVVIESHYILLFANGESSSIGMNGCGGKGVKIESRFIQSYHCLSNQLKVAEKY